MAGKKQQRRRQQVIPASELSWQMPDTSYYASRTNSVSIEVINQNLKMAKESKCNIADVKMKRMEKEHARLASFHQSRCQVLNAEIIAVQAQINDLKKLSEIEETLLKSVEKLGAQRWMQTAVMYPVGPKVFRRIQKQELNLQGLSHQLIVNNATCTAFLAVQRRTSVEVTTGIVERALGRAALHNEEILFSQHNSGHAVQLAHGKEPKIVDAANKTKFALIFDEKFLRSGAEDPNVFYEGLLRCQIVSSRTISKPEKEIIAKQLKKQDGRNIWNRSLRLLEFESANIRNFVVSKGWVEAVNVFYCDGQLELQKIRESLWLDIKYDTHPKPVEGVEVTFRTVKDKQLAERVFFQHSCRMTYFDENGVENLMLKDDDKWRKIVVQYFMHHVTTYEERKWIIRRICQANKIAVEDVTPHTDRTVRAAPNLKKYWNTDLKNLIEHDLANLCRERQDTPWKVIRKTREHRKQAVEEFRVEFEPRNGLFFLDGALMRSTNFTFARPFGYIDEDHTVVPQFHPCLQKSITVSRSSRAVVQRSMEILANELRTKFSDLTKKEDPVMEKDEAAHFTVDIDEDWSNDSDSGSISVSGWPAEVVRASFETLEAFLKPKIYRRCPTLMFGVGEIFVKSLEKKYEGSLIVEVDKYKSEIKLIGDAAEEALMDLEAYFHSRENTGISCNIPLFFPYLNWRTQYIMSSDVVKDIKNALGLAHLRFNSKEQVIEFEGNVDGLEKLVEMLERVSTKIFEKETRGRRGVEEIPNNECPACLCPFDASEDIFRMECGHVYCRPCANNKFRSVDETDTNIVCNQGGCGRPVAPSDISSVILGGPERIKDFDAAKLKPFIVQMKTAILSSMSAINCTTVDCTGILTMEAGNPSVFKNCQACSRQYCRQCLAEPHEGRACEEHRRLREPEASVAEYLKTEGKDKVQECPKCQLLVEKNEGCNHMTCKCKAHFCWLCLFVDMNAGPVVDHLNVVHGGNGVAPVIPEQLENADFNTQQAILNGFAPHARHV